MLLSEKCGYYKDVLDLHIYCGKKNPHKVRYTSGVNFLFILRKLYSSICLICLLILTRGGLESIPAAIRRGRDRSPVHHRANTEIKWQTIMRAHTHMCIPRAIFLTCIFFGLWEKPEHTNRGRAGKLYTDRPKQRLQTGHLFAVGQRLPPHNHPNQFSALIM